MGMEGRLELSQGDVSGKGLGAALLMAKLKTTLRAVAADEERQFTSSRPPEVRP